MEAASLIGILIFVLVVVIIVWACILIIDRTLPPDFSMIAKVLVGVIALAILLYRLIPMLP